MRKLNLTQKPIALEKETVKLFDNDIPLRIIKGEISKYNIVTWTRYFDKDGNRHRDGTDESVVSKQDYPMLIINLKTIHFDGYVSSEHHGEYTNIYFERDSLFNHFHTGDNITYFGLYLGNGIWTNYFIYNHRNGYIEKLYSIDTINERLFDSKFNQSKLKIELDKGINEINIK